jgi:hypothetical protein
LAIATVYASPTGPIPTSILGQGSDTTMFVMNAMDQLYGLSAGCNNIGSSQTPTEVQVHNNQCYSPDPAGTITSENYAHDQVHEGWFVGSSEGIFELDHQTTPGTAHVDFARSSRGPRSSDLTGLSFVAYAQDAIIWEAWDRGTTASGIHAMNNTHGGCAAHPNTTCLTPLDLYHIYGDCTYVNWNQVGGQNVAMTRYAFQPSSGTESTFNAFLATAGGVSTVDADLCPGTQVIPENNNAPIVAAGTQDSAIAPFSVGVWAEQAWFAGGVKPGLLDGVGVSIPTMQNGSYAWTRLLYNVYCRSTCAGGGSNAPTVKYVGEEGWICKPQADTHTTNPNFTGHVADPFSNVDPAKQLNYFTEIQATIQGGNLTLSPSVLGTGKGSVFLPLTLGTIGSGDSNQDYCRLLTT